MATALIQSFNFCRAIRKKLISAVGGGILIPLVAFSQTPNPDEIVRSTKDFLRNISFPKDTLKGVILLVPQHHRITEVRYRIDGVTRSLRINELRPHPQFAVIEKIGLENSFLIYEDQPNQMLLNLFSVQQQNSSYFRGFSGQLILLRLPIVSIRIDTFQINPPPPCPPCPDIDPDTIQIPPDTITIVCWIKRDPGKFLTYVLLPGGAQFYKKHTWEGVGMALLQVAPIPFAIHYDSQRQKFLDLAKEAARRGDQDELDKNFSKSQDYRRRAGIAIGVAVASTLINVFDTFISVKKVQCEPLASASGIRIRIPISNPP